MSVQIELLVRIKGDGATETSMREMIIAIEKEFGHASSAYCEIMAHFAVTMARMQWADADRYKTIELKRRRRQAKEAEHVYSVRM